jgi:sporulation protein YlmC with PRC-barrel domain
MNDKDLMGKAVVSMADGAQVGIVKDLVFRGLDLDSLVVRGERGEGLLPYTSLGKNGPDAITIESYTVVDWNAGPGLGPESKDLHHLRELSVMDADGKMLGHLHDLTMDAAGHVQDIAVRTDGVFGIGAHETVIPASRVCAVGTNMITVAADSKS